MKGFAFDLEGTCVDVEVLHFTAYERALAEFDVTMSAEEVASIPGAIGGGNLFIFSFLRTTFPSLTESALYERKKYHFNVLFNEAVLNPREGLTDYLDYLRSIGAPVSIGSTTRREFGREILKRSGLDMYFDFKSCVFREDVTSLKPSPEVYVRTATSMQIEPTEQIVFEDSIVGITAGMAAGSVVVAIPGQFGLNPRRMSELNSSGAQSLYTTWRSVPHSIGA